MRHVQNAPSKQERNLPTPEDPRGHSGLQLTAGIP